MLFRSRSARPLDPKEAELRAKEADRDLKTRAGETKTKAEQARSAAGSLMADKERHETAAKAHAYVAEVMNSEKRTPSREVASAAKALIPKLRKEGFITAEQADSWAEEANRIDQLFKTRDEAEKAYAKYKTFLKATGIATAAYQALKSIHFPIFLRNLPGD